MSTSPLRFSQHYELAGLLFWLIPIRFNQEGEIATQESTALFALSLPWVDYSAGFASLDKQFHVLLGVRNRQIDCKPKADTAMILGEGSPPSSPRFYLFFCRKIAAYVCPSVSARVTPPGFHVGEAS